MTTPSQQRLEAAWRDYNRARMYRPSAECQVEREEVEAAAAEEATRTLKNALDNWGAESMRDLEELRTDNARLREALKDIKCAVDAWEKLADDEGSLATGGDYQVFRCTACSHRIYVNLPD